MSEKIWSDDAWDDYLYWKTQDMDLVPIGVPKHFHRLTRVLCPRVDHGYEDPFNGKVRIDLPADPANRPDQLLESVQGELGRLEPFEGSAMQTSPIILKCRFDVRIGRMRETFSRRRF